MHPQLFKALYQSITNCIQLRQGRIFFKPDEYAPGQIWHIMFSPDSGQAVMFAIGAWIAPSKMYQIYDEPKTYCPQLQTCFDKFRLIPQLSIDQKVIQEQIRLISEAGIWTSYTVKELFGE